MYLNVLYIMFVQFGFSRTACLPCSHPHRSNGLQRKQGTGHSTTGTLAHVLMSELGFVFPDHPCMEYLPTFTP